ncbi:MAG: hypothetical protein JRH19_27200 [Deltaproteobacteria bacterium]|nr:hypothetical protein [Deltaproteobacteria bacterium]
MSISSARLRTLACSSACSFICSLVLSFGLPGSAVAGVPVGTVEEILIEAAREDQGSGALYYLFIEVEGEDLPISATVQPPEDGDEIILTGYGDGEDLEFDSAGFATFELLQATYPAGGYTFTIGSDVVTLQWNPTQLTGASGEPSLVITAPANGSTKQSSTPDVSYTLDCTNCKDFHIDMYDFATDGDEASFESTLLDQAPGSVPNPILFSTLTPEGEATELLDGLNETEILFGRATFTEESFDSPSSAPAFEYVELSSLLAMSTFSVGPADSDFSVDEILIEAAREDYGDGFSWSFFIEVEGEGLPATATVDPPSGSQIILTTDNPGFEFDFEATDFVSFEDLQDDYPAGGYLFTIGEETVTLDWDPAEPTGATGEPSLTISSPARGATGVSSQPDTIYTFDCTNCKDLDYELFDTATDGIDANFGFGELDVDPPGNYTNPILFSALSSDSEASELPDGGAEAELIIGLADFWTVTFDEPTDVPSFEYVEAGTVIANNSFTVPEPAAPALQLMALAALATVARHRKRARR